MKKTLLTGMFMAVGFTVQMNAQDPVIMTVNGQNVPKSEFEYLYHKNNQQQLSPQPLSDYVEMFKVYKLKVADAKANGIDTTASFKKEMAQYRRDLAAPYIADSAYIYSFIDIAETRAGEEVEASHIMILKAREREKNREGRQLLDSIRALALSGEDFTELADKYSQDRTVERNHGYLGYISSGRYPFDFETAVFETPQGMISEVIESPAGYHIIKPGARRSSKGRVDASHIMKMYPQNATEEQKLAIKNSIDSIYALVMANPSKFGELARKLSDDKGSARQDGHLPIFGSGEMVPEFEEVAFALVDGEISQPVESMYGWHIIRKNAALGAPSREETKEKILKSVANPQDSRFRKVKEHEVDNLIAKHKASINEKTLKEMKEQARQAGIDSLYLANWTTMPNSVKPIAKVGKKEIPASDMITLMMRVNEPAGEGAANILDDVSRAFLSKIVNEEEQEWLYENNADYRNLMNEYTDGSLLYEISLQKVWDKAAKDEEGLEKYFMAHRNNYKWDAPKVKGILIQGLNDSIVAVVRERIEAIPADELVAQLPQLRKEFSGKAQIERILMGKGSNPMVDEVMFGGPKAKPKIANFAAYSLYEPRLLEAPEELIDVKAQVTTDYQNDLEQEWIIELKKTYPVIVNQEVLSTVE